MNQTPVARAIDLAYVAYQVTDLGAIDRFMSDFGLAPAARAHDTLYLRGAASAPYIYMARTGPINTFLGTAFTVGSRAELDALARLPGSSAVAAIDAPGGGWRVGMRTPDGHAVDAVFGRAPAAPIALRPPHPFNAGTAKARAPGQSLRPRREPGQVLRLGHCVLKVRDHDATVAWLQQRFGLLASDYFCIPGDPSQVIGTFLRCDRGATLVDHHALLVTAADAPGVHHVSFEMQDLDAVMGAHDYLAARGYTLDCGVGRHLLGSQIFDYWRDPFGNRVEHYTDGDVVDATQQPSKFAGTADETTQWGAKPPPDFFQ